MQLKNVEDFYPLAPLQEGLLFHSLSDATSQMYLNQAIATLNGRLDVQAFGKAWQQVVQRYAILRSSFVWSGVKEPVQVVSRQVELPLAYHDLRGVSSEVQQQKIESMRQADIAAGFDPGKAPLMRLALVQTADDSHEFFWSFHHILMDGWSMFRVMKDAFSLYDAHCRGNEIRLAETPPYRNYIGWLRKKSLAKAEAFWREKLKGFSAPTPLAMDRISEGENAAARDEEFATEPLWISQEATAQLEYFAQKHHLTLSTITQGAWSLLLSRYSGESDVVFGAIVSGRPADLPAADDMVGLFINTLPVHAIVTARDTVLDWLQNFQRQQAEVRDYEYSPLAKVQQWSDVPPPTSLFDSIFMFENYRKDTPIDKMSDTLQIENIRWYERANYPLAALAIPENDRLLLRLTYHCDRFECAGIKRMLGHWQTLLEGIVTCPHHKIGELPLLKAAEKEQVCVTWNDTKQHFPVEKCAHELFEAHAEQAPEAIAVVYRDQQLTYGELNRRANRLAQHLQDLGIGPEKPVGICMERSLEMIVGMLAVLKAGGAYLPLDPIYPQDRLAFMLSDARAPVLLTEERLKKRLGRAAPNVLCLDSEWKLVPILREKVASKAAAGSRNNVLVDNLAYVIYTSGSTGKPKGVAVSHRGLLNLNFWHQQAFGVKNTDRATQVAGTSFDASVWEIWPYLTAGACLHLVAPETLASPENMRDWLATQEITVSFLPTPLAERVLPLDWPQVMALRYLLTGGDKLHHYPRPDLPFTLVNNYGPTENSVVSTSGVVLSEEKNDAAPAIGRPIANTTGYILDAQLQPLPVGVAGELFVGGESLARGYLHRPELSAERFLPDPFASKAPDGKRLYFTGDRVRYAPDGQIAFLGRSDFQVKIRGFRIELGEIEAAINRHGDVSETIVVARDEAPGDAKLVAYLVPKSGQLPEVSALRRSLAEKLPEYMIPSAFVLMQDGFPLTPNGKVDRRALPAPEGIRQVTTDYVAPQTQIEQQIAKVWQETLRLERVGLHDNFFDLGGHSLVLIQVHGKLKALFDKEISIVDLFKYTTVNALAEFLTNGEATTVLKDSENAEKLSAGKDRLRQLQRRRQVAE